LPFLLSQFVEFGGPETVLRYLGNLIDDALRGGFTVLRP
jgi:hypothetical protein